MNGFEQEPGRKLRQIRERLELKYRDVEEATHVIAQTRGSQEFIVGLSRLADIENRGTVPSIYRLYSLCAIYGLSIGTVLEWYGVQASRLPADTIRLSHRRTRALEPERTGLFATPSPRGTTDRPADSSKVELPLPTEPADFKRTTYIGRQAQKWGAFPVSLLGSQIANRRYAVIGTEDWNMYPLIWPGAFVQVDERRRKPEAGPWTSEADRPVYLVERRDGFRCGWCLQRGRVVTLQYHPASGADPENFLTPDGGEVVGQIVGIAMRLDSAKKRRIRS